MVKRYADATFYISNYLEGRKGAIDTASFDFYAMKATACIREILNGDPDSITDELKMCCCEVAELMENADKQPVGVSSESVGGWSKSYESTKDRNYNLKSDIMSVIRKWLSSTGMLYMGVR